MDNFDKYNTQVEYKTKADFTFYKLYDAVSGNIVLTVCDVNEFVNKISDHLHIKNLNTTNMYEKVAKTEHYIIKRIYEDNYNKHQKEYYDDEKARYEAFINDLYDEFDVQNNPKKELLYAKAYEMGHSGGYSEIYNYFSDLVDLIR